MARLIEWDVHEELDYAHGGREHQTVIRLRFIGKLECDNGCDSQVRKLVVTNPTNDPNMDEMAHMLCVACWKSHVFKVFGGEKE